MRYGNVKVTSEHILDEREIREAEEEAFQHADNIQRRRQRAAKARAPGAAVDEVRVPLPSQ
jgi:hypothetical protein